jgi:hypothetical protein
VLVANKTVLGMPLLLTQLDFEQYPHATACVRQFSWDPCSQNPIETESGTYFLDATNRSIYNSPNPPESMREGCVMQTTAAAPPTVKRVTYLDPTGHVHSVARQLSDRLKDIKGTAAGLLDNGNDTSRFFFLSLAEVLEKDFGVDKVILRTKPTSSKAATKEMLAEMAMEADFLVAGVAL